MVSKKQAFASAVVGGLALLNPAGAAGIGVGRDLALARDRAREKASTLIHLEPLFPPENVFSHLDPHSVPIIKNSRNVLNLIELIQKNEKGLSARSYSVEDGAATTMKVKFLQNMADLLERRTLSSPDPYGLVPGTHIASRFAESYVPFFLATGSGFQKQDSPFKNSAQIDNSRNSMYHHGVYLGNGWVLDFPDGLSTLEKFIGKNKLYYKVTYPWKIDQKDVVRRAVQVFVAGLDPRYKLEYDTESKNCEHVATYIMTGTPRSLQVTRARMTLIGIGLGYWTLVLKVALRKSRKLMRAWGFKPGMNKHEIHERYKNQIAKYSVMNRLRGRVPPQLTQARNTALQL